VGNQSLSYFLSMWGGSLFTSGPDHVQARTYCGPSPAGELAQDPLPRLAFFLDTSPYDASVIRTAGSGLVVVRIFGAYHTGAPNAIIDFKALVIHVC
jgi:hypothetical protein